MAEFDGVRSKLYEEATKEFPGVRSEETASMKKYLGPKSGEVILELGAGTGWFSKTISDMIGDDGVLIATDPSADQLQSIKSFNRENIRTVCYPQPEAKESEFGEVSVDAIWSFGAMHHMFDKGEVLADVSRLLKKGGRVVIGDVFEGSLLAKHFDEVVEKYCITGHDVEFWTEELAKGVCCSSGLDEPEIKDLNLKWHFNSKEDIGNFIYKIHGMTKTTPEECLKSAERILGVEKVGDKYFLNWPMKVIITRKSY